jgi:hypothetical protein
MSEGVTIFGKLKSTSEDFVVATSTDGDGTKYFVMPRFKALDSGKQIVSEVIPPKGLEAALSASTRVAMFDSGIVDVNKISFVNDCWREVE